jgi:hypothetical protein
MPSLKELQTQLLAAERTIRRLDGDKQGLTKRLKAIHEVNDTAEKIRTEIYRISDYDPTPPEWVMRPGTAGSRGGPVLQVSDIHYGEVVSKTEVGGVNEYNKRIAAYRMKRVTETTIDLAFNHMGRAEQKYPGLVLVYGGDAIGGDIHEELAKTNDATPHQSIEELTDLKVAQIEAFAEAFGKVFIPCVVGNHGRSTKKLQMKQRVFTSYEWNLYCNLLA